MGSTKWHLALISAVLMIAAAGGVGPAIAGTPTTSGGTWGPAQPVGIGPDSTVAAISSMSCVSPGNCSAIGSPFGGAFVVNETGGRWGNAELVPALVNPKGAGFVQPFSISCGSAGNCSAAGQYMTADGATGAFVLNETDGSWGKPQLLTGVARIGGTITNSVVHSISCAAAGDCTAVGIYTTTSTESGFAVTETNGT